MCAQWVTDVSGIQSPNEEVCDLQSLKHEDFLWINLQKIIRAAIYLFNFSSCAMLCLIVLITHRNNRDHPPWCTDYRDLAVSGIAACSLLLFSLILLPCCVELIILASSPWDTCGGIKSWENSIGPFCKLSRDRGFNPLYWFRLVNVQLLLLMLIKQSLYLPHAWFTS